MEMTVEKIVHGGWGLCRVNDRVFLVPFAVPGDVVDVSFGEPAKGVTVGWIRKVLQPSPFRKQSLCPVFGICGGCDFDNMSYECEIEAKKEMLREDLRRIGGIGDDAIGKTLPSQSEYRYRNNAQFKAAGQTDAGFFMKRSHEVVPLPEQGCLLLDPVINEFFKRHIQGKALPDGGFRIRSNERGEIFQKGVPGIKPDSCASFYRKGFRFEVGIDDFFQVNRFVIDAWLDLIVGYLEPGLSDWVADIYCGSGLISLYVAGLVHCITGIELNGRAVNNARRNALENGIRKAKFIRADAGKGISGMSAGKVIVDPPRAGLTGRLIADIAEMRPAVVVYASCDTAAFARDVRLFRENGFVLDEVTLVDMFPRTRHMEVVSRLVSAIKAG